MQPGDAPSPEAESQYRQQLDQLTQKVKQVEDNLTELQVDRQAGPVEKAYAARNQGAIGLAISELEEANRGNMSPLVVKPQLVDMFCLTGQPDRALELLSMGASEDPNLGTEPGTSFNRQGLVYFLLGNYPTADHLWRVRAIPRLRYDRSQRALTMGQFITRGELTLATNTSLILPNLVNRQALWEFELGLSLLESGSPDGAADYLTRALKLVPDLVFRPIIAYYLEKLGKPVPELPSKAAKPAGPTAPPATAPKPDTTEPAKPTTGPATTKDVKAKGEQVPKTAETKKN